MKIHINLPTNAYNVYIDSKMQPLDEYSRVVVLTNTTLYALYGGALARIVPAHYDIVCIPDGEEHKNLSTVEYILHELLALRLDRKALLIGFGGGVITDMTGFVASIYQRGIASMYIPTTLLSCVDAAVGGKTGVNTPHGKNLIGSFYQPTAVYIYTALLSTLPRRQISAAMSEVIKMAVLFDGEFLEYLGGLSIDDLCGSDDLRDDLRGKNTQTSAINSTAATALTNEISLDDINPTLSRIIARSIELKASVIIKDEKESSLRKALNYGHTFAHVIEKRGEYKQYLHGEAVAIGLSMINHLASELGLLKGKIAGKIDGLLARFLLPLRAQIDDVRGFYDDLFLDKKSEFSKIKFVIARDIERFDLAVSIDENKVLGFLDGYKSI